MRELKAYIAPTADGTGLADYYLKYEADKVIKELEESHKKEVGQLLMEIVSLKDIDSKNRSAYYKDLAMMAKDVEHQKFKRCVAMAKWCGDAYDKWMMRKEKAISLGKDGVEEYHRARRKLFHYIKWYKRWLELAEKFKEAYR